MSDSPLAGRKALVTGAGRGIGRALAIRLAGLGADVICVARTTTELDETVTLAGQKAIALSCDIGSDSAHAEILARIQKSGGSLDILVHSAGIMRTGTVYTVDLADFDALFAVNVRAPYALTKLLLPLLKEAKGEIVFVNSSIIRAANIAGRGVFAASQAALKALTDSVRDEVNADDVRVMSVMPGTTATPRQKALAAEYGRIYKPERLLQPEDVAQAIGAALLLPRTAELTELFVRPMQKS